MREIHPGDGEGHSMAGGALWDGKHGFCKKVEVWRERFLWVGGLEDGMMWMGRLGF